MPYTIEQYASAATPHPIETRLQQVFAAPALEAYRARCLSTVSTSGVPLVRARAILLLAFSTELQTLFNGLIYVSPALRETRFATRRNTLAIDTALRFLDPLRAALVEEIRALSIPDVYCALLEQELHTTDFRRRVAAVCAILVLAAATQL